MTTKRQNKEQESTVMTMSSFQDGVMKHQSEILPWIRDIVNHFWYCAKQAFLAKEFKVCFWEVNK